VRQSPESGSPWAGIALALVLIAIVILVALIVSLVPRWANLFQP